VIALSNYFVRFILNSFDVIILTYILLANKLYK